MFRKKNRQVQEEEITISLDLEEAEHFRHVTHIRDTYKKRKETIERVFADAKERHCLRYPHYLLLLLKIKYKSPPTVILRRVLSTS